MNIPDETGIRPMLLRFAERFNNHALIQCVRNAPDHLLGLLEPTPIGLAKAQAAWDSLTFADQMTVLRASAHLHRKPLISRAARSANSYVAWHAQTLLGEDIEGDTTTDAGHALAQYTSPSDFNESKSVLSAAVAPQFFALPQPARLAFVADKAVLWGLADVLSFAINNLLNRTVSEDELIELVHQFGWRRAFLVRPLHDRLQANARGGMSDWLESRDASALWDLAATAPEPIARALADSLPPAPEEAIEHLPPDRLRWALERYDVIATELRKSILLSTEGRWAECNQWFLFSAAFCNVTLTYDDFSLLLELPDPRRNEVIQALALTYNPLPLPILCAMRDVLTRQSHAGETDLEDYIHFVGQQIARSAKRVQAKGRGYARRSAIRDLRLYKLATYIVPWEGEPRLDDERLARNALFLRDAARPGDTWATFVRMCKAWDKKFSARPAEEREQEKHLPKPEPPISKRPQEPLLDRTRRIEQQLHSISRNQLRINAALARLASSASPNTARVRTPNQSDQRGATGTYKSGPTWKRWLAWGLGFGLATFLAAAGASQYQSWRRARPEAPVQWADGTVIAPLGNAAVSLVTQVINGAVHYKLSVAFPGPTENLRPVAPALADWLENAKPLTTPANPITLNFLTSANIRICQIQVNGSDIVQTSPPPKPGWTGIEANGGGGCTPAEINDATAWSIGWQ